MITVNVELTERQYVRALNLVAAAIGREPMDSDIADYLKAQLGQLIVAAEQSAIDAAVVNKTVPTVEAF
jgi:hypothetical protein